MAESWLGGGLDNGAQRGAVTPGTVPFCVGPSLLGTALAQP